MALTSPLTLQPYDYIGDSNGRPLDYGQIYIGIADKDPEFNQIPVYLDKAMTKLADQPLRTKGGFIEFAGDLTAAYASASVYSVKVLDKQGRKVIYKAEMMRDNLTDDALQSLNTAIGESQQAAENTLNATIDSITNNAINTVQDAINNTAVEGGVLADTFVTATANGLGAVARTQRDKNSDFVSVKDFGALGDGSGATVQHWYTTGSAHYRGYANLAAVQVDYPHVTASTDTIDWAAIQKVINTYYATSIPKGVYCVNRTVHTRKGTKLIGAGQATALKGMAVEGAVLKTFSGSGQATAPDQSIGDFCIIGTGTTAMSLAHFAVSGAYNIRLSHPTEGSFKGVDGFVFEYFWGSTFERLYTNGAALSGTPFVFYKNILDSDFTLLYTSNITDYSFVYDSASSLYATGVASGSGIIRLNLATAQGARKYAIHLVNATKLTFNDLYTENCNSILRADKTLDVIFNSSSFLGVNVSTTHDMWLAGSTGDYATGVAFNNCSFPEKEHIFGRLNAAISVHAPRVTNNKSFFANVRRTTETPPSMSLTVFEQQTHESVTYMKTNNYAYKFAKMSITEVGGLCTWVSAPAVVPPLTENTRY